nr:immunoglobulin heavy chain junction region [Mus musculus]
CARIVGYGKLYYYFDYW